MKQKIISASLFSFSMSLMGKHAHVYKIKHRKAETYSLAGDRGKLSSLEGKQAKLTTLRRNPEGISKSKN